MIDIRSLIDANVNAKTVVRAVLFNYDYYSALAYDYQDVTFIIDNLIEKYQIETAEIDSYSEPYYAERNYYEILVLKLEDRYFKVTREYIGGIGSKPDYIDWKEVSRKVTTKTIEVVEYVEK